MTIQQIDHLHFNPQLQTLEVSYDQEIINTTETLFNWPKGTSIFDAHPFFQILEGFDRDDATAKEGLNFPCIHLTDEITDKICDITITFNPSAIQIVLFDYTVKYKELNLIAQQKNESILMARELELKNKYLLEKEEFKNSFIANINHEIRTPLTSIIGFVEILENTNLNFEQEELARIIKRESRHLNVLIDDMIDIAKIESGTLQVVKERFAFLNLMDGFDESYSKIAEEKGLEFEIKIEDKIQEFLIGDKTRIFQIINNVLSNAFKFTEEGKITLSVTKNYQRTNKVSLTFKIEDTGIGIHKEDLPHLFERFTRFNLDKQRTGTGLGLAIVKNLVDLLSGEIKVTSTPDKGSTFSIKLPFTFEVTKTKTPKRKKKNYELPERKKKFRILVVEDEEITQFLIMKILIATGNFFVDVAINGQDAIQYIERRTYDLVLVDLTVSQIDGYKLTHMIRNNYGDSFISDLPIIGLSSKYDDGTRDKCLKSGLDDFISKPFEQEELLYKMIKQIAKKAAE